MDKPKQTHHCYLDRVLTPEEAERVRGFLRQQGIYLSEDEVIAHIGKEGPNDQCPYQYGFGDWTKYCANQCQLEKNFGTPPKAGEEKKKKG